MHVRLLTVEALETLVEQRFGDTGFSADEVVTEVRSRSSLSIPAPKAIRRQVRVLSSAHLFLRVHSNLAHSVMYVLLLYARHYTFLVPTSCRL